MRNAIIKQYIRNQMNTTTKCSFLLLPEPQYLLPGPSDSNSQPVKHGECPHISSSKGNMNHKQIGSTQKTSS